MQIAKYHLQRLIPIIAFYLCNPKCVTARHKRRFQVVITLFYAFSLHAATASGVTGIGGLSSTDKIAIGIGVSAIIVAIVGIIVTICIAILKKRRHPPNGSH